VDNVDNLWIDLVSSLLILYFVNNVEIMVQTVKFYYY